LTSYDISLHENSIWCAYPTSHTVKRFSLQDGKEELIISEGSMGDDRGTIFCYPESILFQFENKAKLRVKLKLTLSFLIF
jgi:hypothetical protein